jgi:YjbE family integral membrane protein
MMEFGTPDFWVALGKIVWINILLSGDNAIVIAMAARSLPAQQQKQAIFIGSAGAIVLRILLTLVAVQLLALPFLKLVGAVLLIYIGVTLLMDSDDGDDDGKPVHGTLAAAIRTILIADLVMSLDNVIGVAAAAKGSTLLLVIGLGLSIPLVIFGSTLLLKVIERFPIIVWAGAALLGFLAGEIAVEDPAIKQAVDAFAAGQGIAGGTLSMIAGIVGAAIVLLIVFLLKSRARSAKAA